MKFVDPYTVVCPACGTSSDQHPDALLDLHAVCPHCGGNLNHVGADMRRIVNDSARYFGLIETAVDMAEAFSIVLRDDELEPIQTVGDLVALVRRKVSDATGGASVETPVLRSVASHAGQDRDITLDTTITSAFRVYDDENGS